MIQMRIALFAACVWLPFSFAQEIPRKESFSLKPVLDYVGAVEAISVSPNLSTVALAFDDPSLPQHSELRSHFVLLGLPDWPGKPLRKLGTYSVDPESRISGLTHMTETLLRAESLRSLEVDPLRMGYSYEYTFFDLTGDASSYSLREDLGLKHVLYMRQYSESVYVVAHDPSGSLDVNKIVFSVIKHDPLTQISTILYNFRGDPNLGHELLHNPVNAPGRDVWVYGKDKVRVSFNHFDRKNSLWLRMVLDVNGYRAQLKVDHGDPRKEDLLPIENTDEYFKWKSESALMIYQEDDTGIRNLIYRDEEVSPFQYLNMVSKGFVGGEAGLNMQRHFLYTGGGQKVLLTTDRFVKTSQRDGGLVGVTIADRADGNMNLVRVIYDRENLVKSEVSGKDLAADCTNHLLQKIQNKVKKRK